MTKRLFFLVAALLPATAASAGPAQLPAKRAGSAALARRVAAVRRVTTAGENTKPFIITRPQGGAYLAWAQKVGDRTAIFFARSTTGLAFDAPVRLSPPGMDLDLGAENGPRVATDGKGNLYVVWVAGVWETSPGSPPAQQVNHAGHGGHAGHPPRPAHLNIYLARSSDDGRTFSAPRQVNDGPDGPEHRFPAVAVDTQGAVYIVWLDKRKQIEARPDYSRVYLARSTDGGRTFSPNVDATDGQDSPICHCCQLAVATHPDEGVCILFRNDVHDLRDMFLVRSQDGGKTFSRPAPIEDTRWIVPT